MALPDVSFTNNIGTISIKRCLIGIHDQWQWNGRAVKFTKGLQIDGVVKQSHDSPEGLEAVLTQAHSPTDVLGELGTLTLPWAVLNNIKISNISYPSGQWINWKPVSVTFEDPYPLNNVYTFTYFGFKLHNPRISIPVPVKGLKDEYVPLPWNNSSKPSVEEARRNVIRIKTPEDQMQIDLSGTMFFEDGRFPTTLVDSCSQRVGGSQTIVTTALLLPTGYPMPFSLGDAVPELKQDLNLAHCIVAQSKLMWDVERSSCQLQATLLCPPQWNWLEPQ